MPKFKRFLFYWLPPLMWMVVIFSASADTHSVQHSSRIFVPIMLWLFPHMSHLALETGLFYCRKCCHLTEYAILGLLLWRAIRQPGRKPARPWRWDEAGLVLALVFFYAATDELHQSFVPTRTAHVTDVLIDTTGGAIALLLLWGFGKFRRRKS